jgi:hypothetical protein
MPGCSMLHCTVTLFFTQVQVVVNPAKMVLHLILATLCALLGQTCLLVVSQDRILLMVSVSFARKDLTLLDTTLSVVNFVKKTFIHQFLEAVNAFLVEVARSQIKVLQLALSRSLHGKAMVYQQLLLYYPPWLLQYWCGFITKLCEGLDFIELNHRKPHWLNESKYL